MRRARENQERFVVDKRGELQVIMMSITDFIDTIAPAPDFLKEIWRNQSAKASTN
jgi:hypothetical protein